MKQENTKFWIRFLICFGVAAAISVAIFAIQGFFTDNIGVNLQVLADGFSVSGALLLMYAGMMFISKEGALLGISYALRNAALTFIPGGRAKQELYKDYRERKMSKDRKSADVCVWIVGAIFFAVGLALTLIWYVKFYNIQG